MMLQLLQIAQDILVKGKIDGAQIRLLRYQLYAEGHIDRAKADFLIKLHQRVQPQTPDFEHFFYQALKDHLLAREQLGPEEADWLQQTLSANGEFKDEERKLLHELKAQAKRTTPEFEILYKDRIKSAHEICTRD